MLETTRLATTRREEAVPQVSPAVGQSASTRQRFWDSTHILDLAAVPLVMQTSLENTMQMSPTLPVHWLSEVHLGLLPSCEQMPRQWLPEPQSLSLVQEVALLLAQKP